MGVFQADVAARMTVSQRMVSDLENGIRAFSPEECEGYAKALGMSLKTLKARVRALGGVFPPERDETLATRRNAVAAAAYLRSLGREPIEKLAERALAWAAENPGGHLAGEWAAAIYPEMSFKRSQDAGIAASLVLAYLEQKGKVVSFPGKYRTSPKRWELAK